jgi:hypothetical protein
MPTSCNRCGKDFYIPLFIVLTEHHRMTKLLKVERVCFECLKSEDSVVLPVNNPKKVSAA